MKTATLLVFLLLGLACTYAGMLVKFSRFCKLIIVHSIYDKALCNLQTKYTNNILINILSFCISAVPASDEEIVEDEPAAVDANELTQDDEGDSFF